MGLAQEGVAMAELVRTNNVGLIAGIEALLAQAGIPYLVADRNMSVLEGSIGAIQARVLVADDHEAEARALLAEAGFGDWLQARR